MVSEISVKQNGRLTQHKRFVSFGTHPNFGSAETSFMLRPLGDMPITKYNEETKYGQ
jgi:hypothetical protein